MVSEDQGIRIFQGELIKELLYKVDEFIKLRETTNMVVVAAAAVFYSAGGRVRQINNLTKKKTE